MSDFSLASFKKMDKEKFKKIKSIIKDILNEYSSVEGSYNENDAQNLGNNSKIQLKLYKIWTI